MSDNPPAKPPWEARPGHGDPDRRSHRLRVLIFVVIVLSMILGLTSHRATVGLVVFVIFLAAAAVAPWPVSSSVCHAAGSLTGTKPETHPTRRRQVPAPSSPTRTSSRSRTG